MRVISGYLKGRRFAEFKGRDIRPTSDKVRQAIFNILGPGPFGAVLDIYAGTGAMGIEALSRGAGEAVFVDSSDEATSLIRKNLSALGLVAGVRVVRSDAVSALVRLSGQGQRFGLVFIDPPYMAGLLEKTLGAIDCSDLLEDKAVVVVEASKKIDIKPLVDLGCLELTDERAYGDTAVYFFRRVSRQ